MARARLAIRALVRQREVSGRDLERLLGHIVFIGLCRRESLSVLASCYRFVATFRTGAGQLWGSARRELMLWDALSPLLWQDLVA